MIAVATFVVFQGFAQKVNPWLRGDDNKTTEQVRAYWLDGIAPQGVVSTIKHSEIVRAIEQSFGNAGIKEDWAVVVARAKCIEPPADLKKRTIRFWGSLGGKAQLMDQPRELRRDEKIFVDPETNFILGGCQCANLLDVPMEWSTPLCEPEVSLNEYTSYDDAPLPADTIRIKRKYSGSPNGGYERQFNPGGDSNATANAHATAGSGSANRSDNDCTWCGLEDRDGYMRIKDIEAYIDLRNKDVRFTNDEHIRVKKAESEIRRDDMINMMIAQNMCNNCQPTGRSVQYEGNEYYEVRQGNQNAWLAPFLGGLAGGVGGGLISHLIFNNRTGRPVVQQWNGWQPQPYYYGPGAQPPPQQQIGWEQTVSNNGWNSGGAAGLGGGFVPTNGR